MNESLPLFEEAPDNGVRPAMDTRERVAPARAQAGSRDPHLEAARRIARGMRDLPSHSPAQVAAGQRICRHLIAMLQAADSRVDKARH